MAHPYRFAIAAAPAGSSAFMALWEGDLLHVRWPPFSSVEAAVDAALRWCERRGYDVARVDRWGEEDVVIVAGPGHPAP